MDGSELRALLEQHHAESFGWALSCCQRDRGEAEVVLQTVYLKILQGRARFNGRASFKTWLFAVIRNTAMDERRRNVLRRLRLARYHRNRVPPAPMESPEDAAYRSEIQAAFRRALATLPRRQRETLQLVFAHDLSLAEAARVMGITIGSARRHYERGKRRLRERMRELEELP